MFRLAVTGVGTLAAAVDKMHSRAEVEVDQNVDILDEAFIENLDSIESGALPMDQLKGSRLKKVSAHSSMAQESHGAVDDTEVRQQSKLNKVHADEQWRQNNAFAHNYEKDGGDTNKESENYLMGNGDGGDDEYDDADEDTRSTWLGNPKNKAGWMSQSDKDQVKGKVLARKRAEANAKTEAEIAKATAENAEEEKKSKCFAGISSVATADGSFKMLQDITKGELVRTAAGFEPVIGFLHHAGVDVASFLRIEHSAGTLLVSPAHRLFTAHGSDVLAEDIRVGDSLPTMDNASVVTSVTTVSVDTILAPLTPSGTIVVDNVLASSYADVPHWLGQFVLAPVRFAANIFGMPMARAEIKSTQGSVLAPILTSN